MDEIFNLLSSSARLKKPKRKHPSDGSSGSGRIGRSNDGSNDGNNSKKRSRGDVDDHPREGIDSTYDDGVEENDQEELFQKRLPSRDRTGKRDLSVTKRDQIHREEIAAFRRTMGIRLESSNRHDTTIPDPISRFGELNVSTWWKEDDVEKNDSKKNKKNNKKNSSTSKSDVTSNTNANTNTNMNSPSFQTVYRSIQCNIESGRWKEPTPIQMQAIPTLLERRDLIGCAPTGSGKSGAFIIPALLLSLASHAVYYQNVISQNDEGGNGDDDYDDDDDDARSVAENKHKEGMLPIGEPSNAKKRRQKKKQISEASPHTQSNVLKKSTSPCALSHKGQGEIRTLLLAPSRELATQLHREVERLGAVGSHGNGARRLSSLILERSNASHVISGSAGGKRGLDVLVTTPLRLVDCLERGLQLRGVRLVVLDEADRLLDASSDAATTQNKKEEKHTKTRHGSGIGKPDSAKRQSIKNRKRNVASNSSEEQREEADLHEDDQDCDHIHQGDSKHEDHENLSSGSSRTKTFLSQLNTIFSALPATCTRALFSATVTPTVRALSESILRDPVDVTIANIKNGSGTSSAAGANPDIDQQLTFVGREEGKLLAIRQLVSRGQLTPPVLVFVQSQERAQALFHELLYDGIHVDVLHAGRSKAARDEAVARFRQGQTWVLIATDLVARGVDFRAVNRVINYDIPTSGVTYVHRIGRCGRAGRPGTAMTLFTEADLLGGDHVRTIANIMKQSGCHVEDWMLQLPRTAANRNKSRGGGRHRKVVPPKRKTIDTTPGYEKMKRHNKRQRIAHTKKLKSSSSSDSQTRDKDNDNK